MRRKIERLIKHDLTSLRIDKKQTLDDLLVVFIELADYWKNQSPIKLRPEVLMEITETIKLIERSIDHYNINNTVDSEILDYRSNFIEKLKRNEPVYIVALPE